MNQIIDAGEQEPDENFMSQQQEVAKDGKNLTRPEVNKPDSKMQESLGLLGAGKEYGDK
jgi:hypothetical protein